MKKLLTLLLVMVGCTMVVQAKDEFRLSYCEHTIASTGGQGNDDAGEISGAIYVPQAKLKTLVGNAITRVDVGLISRINVRQLTVWVRSAIDGANLAEASIDRGALGWNEIGFASPYVITDQTDGLYIGFTFTNVGSSHPVSFVGKGQAGTSFFRSEAGGKWQDMGSKGNLSLEAVVEGSSLPQYDLALTSASVSPNLSRGANVYTVRGSVSNLALRDVGGFDVTMRTADGLSGTAHVEQSIGSGANGQFVADITMPARAEGKVEVSISALDEGTDANADNNTLTATVRYLRNAVVEEFTTESCPNCPAGAAIFHEALERLEADASRIIPVCHHSGFGTDVWTQPCDEAFVSLYNCDGSSYAPAYMFDRQPVFTSMVVSGNTDNVTFLSSSTEVVNNIKAAWERETHAIVGLTIDDVTTAGSTATVTLTATIEHDGALAMSQPMLQLYTTEDDVPAIRQQGVSSGEKFLHQHLIRTCNGSWGENVQFDGRTYSYTYSVELDEAWNKDKLHFVAILANHDANNVLNNRIENAASVDFAASMLTPVEAPGAAVSKGVVYDLQGRRISRPQHGIYIMDGRKVAF